MKPITLGIIVCSALLGLAQAAQAQSAPSRMPGRYGYTSTGSIVNPPAGPVHRRGSVTFTETDVHRRQTTSIAGNLVDETIQGTFTVNPDCTGRPPRTFPCTTLARTSRIDLVWDIRENRHAASPTPGTNISPARKMTGKTEVGR
jgi:hypothetical protein